MKAPGRRHTQARGRQRRQAILRATRNLLTHHDIEQVTLTTVAEEAGIPGSSIYYFYPDMKAIYVDVASAIIAEMIRNLIVTTQATSHSDWHSLVRFYLEECAVVFNEDRAARQLILGPGSPLEVKRISCCRETRYGYALLTLIDRYFHLPLLDRAELTFERSIQICEVLYTNSVMEHDNVDEENCQEGIRATISYLSLYVSPILARKNPALVPVNSRKSAAKEFDRHICLEA